MFTLTPEQIHRAAIKYNRPNLRNELRFDGTVYRLTREEVAAFNPNHPALQRPTALEVQPTKPLPREEWPLWAFALALLSNPEDRGLGDVIERTIGPIGGDKFKIWHEKIFRKKCGCEARKDKWNLRWPLKP